MVIVGFLEDLANEAVRVNLFAVADLAIVVILDNIVILANIALESASQLEGTECYKPEFMPALLKLFVRAVL